MTWKQTLVLAVPAIALCALGALVLRLSADLDERAHSDSIAAFLSGALDGPSKLTPDHVRMVISAAKTIEEAGRRGEIGLAVSIAGIARSCFVLAAMSAVSATGQARLQMRKARLGSGSAAFTSSTVLAAIRSAPSILRNRCVTRPTQTRSSPVAWWASS
jgi:hypothetical protein